MIEALKPCPFCGGKASLWCEKLKPSYYGWLVVCFSCHINKTQEEVIAAWNRRASPSWSTEPPAEEGFYWVRCIHIPSPTPARITLELLADGKQYLIVEILGEPISTKLSMLNPTYKFEWLKIDAPAPPEESEVPND